MLTNPLTPRQLLLEDLATLLSSLRSDQLPAWGRMTPQHMVEHLIVTVKLSHRQVLPDPPATTQAQKQYKEELLNPTTPFPMNRTSSLLGDALAALKYASLEEAKDGLLAAVRDFYAFFTTQPEVQPYLPMFGAVSFQELETFHYKHFYHHLRQFDLLH